MENEQRVCGSRVASCWKDRNENPLGEKSTYEEEGVRREDEDKRESVGCLGRDGGFGELAVGNTLAFPMMR